MSDVIYNISSGFFDSVNGDRLYSAADMNKPYKRVIADGIFPTPQGTPSTDFQVVAVSGMSVAVLAGNAMIGARWAENTDDVGITIAGNSSSSPRIDSIFLHIDTGMDTRAAGVVYRQGTAAGTPTAPAMVQTDNITELRLADILVAPSAAIITQANITDQRGGSDCPWVAGLIQQVDTSALFDQYRAAYAEQQQDQADEWNTFMDHLARDYDISMSLRKHESTYMSTAAASLIPINIDGYDTTKDLLQVYINGIFAVEGTHYIVKSAAQIQLTNAISAGQNVHFVIYKAVMGGAQPIIPTDEQVQDAVDAYMDAHPGALVVDPELSDTSTHAIQNKAVTEALAGVNGRLVELGDDLSDIEGATVVKNSGQTVTDILPELTWTEYAYMAPSGVPSSASTLRYSNKISVSEGDVLSVTPSAARLRYVCAYSDGTAVSESGASTAGTSYTVPSGIDEVIVTVYMSGGAVPATLTKTHSETTYTNILDDDIAELRNDIGAIENVIVANQYTDETIIDNVPTFTVGAVGTNGVVQSYTSFNYSQKISVQPGDVVTAVAADDTQKGLRFVCAYNGNTAISDSGSSADVTSFTVPEGIDGVVVSVRIADSVTLIKIARYAEETSAYIQQIPMGYMSAKGSLNNGGTLTLPFHNVKINNRYIFNANVSTFGSIRFIKQANAYITVDGTNITVTTSAGDTVIPHGLTIGNNISLLVENETSVNASLIRLSSDGQEFSHTNPVNFLMDSGTPTIESIGSVLTECAFSWVSKNVNAPIWMFGDSYFSWYESRWTYYLARDGYTESVMLNGFAGQASASAYTALVNLLNITTPKMVVWCLGMNDADDSAVNVSWYSCYQKIIELKKKYGFELVLYTVPSTPTMDNSYKDTIIRSSGYRYIEADKAVRTNDGGDWVTGALNADNVHPTAIGAKILYYRILADLPELMSAAE